MNYKTLYLKIILKTVCNIHTFRCASKIDYYERLMFQTKRQNQDSRTVKPLHRYTHPTIFILTKFPNNTPQVSPFSLFCAFVLLSKDAQAFDEVKVSYVLLLLSIPL